MSFDISSVGGIQPIEGASRANRAAARKKVAPADAAEDPVSVDTIPPSPPPEVQNAIGVANDAYHRLAQSGRELRFAIDETTGKVIVALHNANGEQLSTLPPSKALEVAEGGSVD